jgi:hypothetical protein
VSPTICLSGHKEYAKQVRVESKKGKQAGRRIYIRKCKEGQEGMIRQNPMSFRPLVDRTYLVLNFGPQSEESDELGESEESEDLVNQVSLVNKTCLGIQTF